MTPTGIALRRKLAVSVTAAAVAASLTLAVSAPGAAAQDAGPYPDTPAGAYYAQPVEALDQNGVFAGTLCDQGFCPNDPLDRATMAVWTVRVLDQQDPEAVTSTRFADVEATHPHAAFIERFAERGITSGCGDGTFCPEDNVRRAHMAVFLSGVPSNWPKDPTRTSATLPTTPGSRQVSPNSWRRASPRAAATAPTSAPTGRPLAPIWPRSWPEPSGS